jgi:sec-independent protein translocase protein TatC
LPNVVGEVGVQDRGRASGSWSSLRSFVAGILVAAAAMSREMSFLDHLEELRRRILWSVAFVFGAFIACWVFSSELYTLARIPIEAHPDVTLTISRPQDIFSLHLKVSLVAGLFVAAPLVLTQVWMFISPGLYRHERRYAVPFVLSASVLFVTGGVLGYFFAFPMALDYFIQWIRAENLTPMIDAIEYFNLMFQILVALGIVFQIPAVVFVLSRIGLVDGTFLIRNSKYAVLLTLVVAALITPPDIVSMMTIAGPMLVLYGVGIAVAFVFGRRRRREVA